MAVRSKVRIWWRFWGRFLTRREAGEIPEGWGHGIGVVEFVNVYMCLCGGIGGRDLPGEGLNKLKDITESVLDKHHPGCCVVSGLEQKVAGGRGKGQMSQGPVPAVRQTGARTSRTAAACSGVCT